MSNRECYIQEDYQKKSTFASFLPGIAGEKGIPAWCYYVNRGQGVVSFGVQDKDHSIMEFYPAHVAYSIVGKKGFRTFLRVNGEVSEPFSNPERGASMEIEPNTLRLIENQENGLQVQVKYFTLPEEPLGGIVRRVTFVNNSTQQMDLEILDGMPEIIPYGVGIDVMKSMTETTKAWMQSDFFENSAIYKVRASMEDSAEVKEVLGVAFAYGIDSENQPMQVIVDPVKIFEYDNGFDRPYGFFGQDFDTFAGLPENHTNEVPSAFFLTKLSLAPGEERTISEVYGQVNSKEILAKYLSQKIDGTYFDNKETRAEGILHELTAPASSKTASQHFDNYVKNCYMDNGLRGGFPTLLGHNKVFYRYSRKHGDLERDYNFFSMLPEYESQGNGNFRDVNQNRRVDTFFSPFVGRENIHTFYNLLQPDGYNPLGVEKQTYRIGEAQAKELLGEISGDAKEAICSLLRKPFTPGQLLMLLEDVVPEKSEELFIQIIDFSEGGTEGNFGEGYWCDHFSYTQDLIDEYLLIYPEQEMDLLLEDGYTYFAPTVKVNPRVKRYEKTKNGIRQYHSIDETGLNPASKQYQNADGTVLKNTLFDHMLTLVAVKFSTLDPYGMGIEMEGGKPGWYDALNGLPGMIGSAMSETLEIDRVVDYLRGVTKSYSLKAELPLEIATLLRTLYQICLEEEEKLLGQQQVFSFWEKISDAREEYREKVYEGFSGKKTVLEENELSCILRTYSHVLKTGIQKAYGYGKGIMPTYFYYEMTDYELLDGEGILPKNFEVREMPPFLEGSVHAMKVTPHREDRKKLHEAVRSSNLYDEKLHMYKVNAALASATTEIGRCRSFTPGWLENESVFLHMEYKYLLELIRGGLYEEFFTSMKDALVPFLDPEMYGRSTLENSSFIASSANPNEKIHGKGFVARLSGSTVEFLSIFRRMMFGEKLFTIEENNLVLRFAPALPAYLIPEDGKVTARFLGSCDVTYHFPKKADFTPENTKVEEMTLTYLDGRTEHITGDALLGNLAEAVRRGEVREILVVMA